MIYRIVATIVLIAAITAVGVYLEPSTKPRSSAPSTPANLDDGAMKSLRIN